MFDNNFHNFFNKRGQLRSKFKLSISKPTCVIYFSLIPSFPISPVVSENNVNIKAQPDINTWI